MGLTKASRGDDTTANESIDTGTRSLQWGAVAMTTLILEGGGRDPP
jgi:hypothetical protein